MPARVYVPLYQRPGTGEQWAGLEPDERPAPDATELALDLPFRPEVGDRYRDGGGRWWRVTAVRGEAGGWRAGLTPEPEGA